MHTQSPVSIDSAIWQDPEDMPQNPTTLLDLMSVEVANLLALESSLAGSKNSQSGSKALSNLVLKAKSVDDNLACWPDSVPFEWFPKKVQRQIVPKSVIDAGFYGEDCDIYSDVMVCRAWNDWRSARLRVLSLIAKYELGEETLTSIQQLADGICASFPYILGDRMSPAPIFAASVLYPSLEGHSVPLGHHNVASCYGGWHLHTPLNQVIAVGLYLREGQLTWMRGQGQRLQRVYDVTEDGCNNTKD